MNKKACAFENIIEAINELEAQNCIKCTPCREGRKWLKNLIENASNFADKKTEYFNFIIEMAHQMSQLSNCARGKKTGNLIMNYMINNKLDINFHLESKECRFK